MAFNSETASKAGKKSKRGSGKDVRKIRDMVGEIIEGNLDRIKANINGMESKERLNAVFQLMKFVLPTLTSQEIDLSTDMDFEPPQWLKDLDEDELPKKLLK